MTDIVETYIMEIGGYGRYQQILTCFLVLPAIALSLNTMSIIFTTFTPDYNCSDFSSFAFINSSYEDICLIENVTKICMKWIYDESQIKETIVTQFDLVCDKAWYVATAKTVAMSGLFIGVLSSAFSDRFGRKKITLISLFVTLVANFGSTFSNSYILFLCFRFIISASSVCAHSCAFVLAIELVPSSHTSFIGCLKNIFWSSGFILLTTLAYFMRTRHILELAITIYGVIVFLAFWIVPESPKWLYTRQRIKEADTILSTIAKRNGYVFDKKEQDISNIEEKTTLPQESYWKVFTYQKLLFVTIALYFVWFSVSLTFYGLNFLVGKLDGNLYLNTFLIALVEIPTNISAIFILKYTRRIVCMFTSFLAVGALLLTTIAIPFHLNIINTVIGILGKVFVTFAFGVVYIYTGEVYPTSIRATGIAISSLFARVGGALAPYVLEIDDSNTFGMVFFGIFALVSSLLMLPQPETKNKVIPQVIDDCLDPAICMTNNSEDTTSKDFL